MARLINLISSHGIQEDVDLVLELFALPPSVRPKVYSPLRLKGQTPPEGKANGLEDRDHYWRKTLLVGQNTGLRGLYKRHQGLDLSFYNILGKGFYPLLYAPTDMEIIRAGRGNRAGNYIKGRVEARGRFGIWWFFHLGQMLVERGQAVEAGDVLANFKRPDDGWGGWAFGPHLHCGFSIGDDPARGIDWQLFEVYGRQDLDEEQVEYAGEIVRLVKEFGPRVPEAELPSWLYGKYKGKGPKRWLRTVDLKPHERL